MNIKYFFAVWFISLLVGHAINDYMSAGIVLMIVTVVWIMVSSAITKGELKVTDLQLTQPSHSVISETDEARQLHKKMFVLKETLTADEQALYQRVVARYSSAEWLLLIADKRLTD